MLLGRTVVSVEEADGRVTLALDDGTRRSAEHILLATGYRVDIEHYAFLDPALLEEIDRVDGYPRLGPGFESSVPGLHILGAPAAWSFGPLFRFVAGAEYAGRALARLLRVDDEHSIASRELAEPIPSSEARGT
jgi:hypothetical protein